MAELRTILLLPPHLTLSDTPSNLPLLTALQSLLNVSYTKTCGAQPDIFTTPFLRIADPSQFADVIGAEGFTVVVVLAVKNAISGDERRGEDVNDKESEGKDAIENIEVVAAGSVKAFGDGDITQYTQWSKNFGGKEWEEAQRKKTAAASEEPHHHRGLPPAAVVEQTDQRSEKIRRSEIKYEITAFGVSLTQQSRGLGARVLKDIEWLLGSKSESDTGTAIVPTRLNFAREVDAPLFSGVLRNGSGEQIHGIDLDKLKEIFNSDNHITDRTGGYSASTPSSASDLGLGESCMTGQQQLLSRNLVLICVRELGTEAYYHRRGYVSIWSGPVPVGMWDCKVECTMVYMEKRL